MLLQVVGHKLGGKGLFVVAAHVLLPAGPTDAPPARVAEVGHVCEGGRETEMKMV